MLIPHVDVVRHLLCSKFVNKVYTSHIIEDLAALKLVRSEYLLVANDFLLKKVQALFTSKFNLVDQFLS